MSRKLVIVALVWGVALAVQCGAASATPSWTAPGDFNLPSGAPGGLVHIAYQTGGTATIAYLEVVSTSPIQTVLHVGVIPPGGTYQEQLRIPSTSSLTPADVSVAEAPDGAAVLEWASLQGDSTGVPLTYFSSYRPAGSSTWESPTTIFTDSTTKPGISEDLVPAVSADGTGAAGVEHVDPSIPNPYGYRVDVTVHPPGGAWGAATQISPSGEDSENLVMGFDATGDLTAAFRTKNPTRFTLFVVTRPESTGIWNSLQDVTGSNPTADVYSPQLGVAGDGSAVIAFQYAYSAAPNTLDVSALTRSGQSGPWSSLTDLTPGAASSSALAAGVSPTGKAYVLYRYQGSNSGLDCVGLVRATLGGTFSAPQCVSPTNFEAGSSGGISFLGNDAYLAWSGQSNVDSKYVVQGSSWLDAGTQPDVATNLESPSSTGLALSDVTPDDDGGVAVFWTSGSVLRAAAFDAGGPNLVSATVPSAAVAGRAVAMSATFADLWSGVNGAPAWSFGDGATGSGGQVNHTYAKGGKYTVTVTAADGLGNQTSISYTVTVIGPPVLSAVSQAAKRWREKAKRHRGHGRLPPVGTAFQFTLDGAAGVKLTFTESLPGRRVKGKCTAATRTNRKKPRCTRTLKIGSIVAGGVPGVNRIKFAGTLANHGRLSPGSYRVTIVATNAAGPSSTVTLGFTVVAS